MAYTAIDNPELYFQAKTYSGTGSSQAITFDGSEDMSGSLMWIKSRSTNDAHRVFDTVRESASGAGSYLVTNTTDAENTDSTQFTSFDSDGFTLSSGGATNGSGETFVAWCWKESATAGFDIVGYTGTGSNTTVSHSLGVVPAMFITKNRTSSSNTWTVYNKNLADAAQFLGLNGTGASDTSAANFNSTAPTSSVFSVGTDAGTNGSDAPMIAYLFADVQGFSKFGSYIGNGSTDGTFVFCGFRPAFVMVKRTDDSNDWKIIDNKRSTYNPTAGTLKANSNGVEDASEIYYDFCSNGYKIRLDAGALNASGGTYIYMAFAEAPFVNSNGVPCNAR